MHGGGELIRSNDRPCPRRHTIDTLRFRNDSRFGSERTDLGVAPLGNCRDCGSRRFAKVVGHHRRGRRVVSGWRTDGRGVCACRRVCFDALGRRDQVIRASRVRGAKRTHVAWQRDSTRLRRSRTICAGRRFAGRVGRYAATNHRGEKQGERHNPHDQIRDPWHPNYPLICS
jgi:hypothetical protein